MRSVIRVAVERISDSCGYRVPRYDFVAERPRIAASIEKKGPDGLVEYRATKKRVSIDGLPGVRV